MFYFVYIYIYVCVWGGVWGCGCNTHTHKSTPSSRLSSLTTPTPTHLTTPTESPRLSNNAHHTPHPPQTAVGDRAGAAGRLPGEDRPSRAAHYQRDPGELTDQFTIYSLVTPQPPIFDMRWIRARRLSYTLRRKTRYMESFAHIRLLGYFSTTAPMMMAPPLRACLIATCTIINTPAIQFTASKQSIDRTRPTRRLDFTLSISNKPGRCWTVCGQKLCSRRAAAYDLDRPEFLGEAAGRQAAGSTPKACCAPWAAAAATKRAAMAVMTG